MHVRYLKHGLSSKFTSWIQGGTDFVVLRANVLRDDTDQVCIWRTIPEPSEFVASTIGSGKHREKLKWLNLHKPVPRATCVIDGIACPVGLTGIMRTQAGAIKGPQDNSLVMPNLQAYTISSPAQTVYDE